MSVKTVSKDALRRMEGSEGLILQGCGGSLDCILRCPTAADAELNGRGAA